ncbi:MAG: HlyC/CorC family transporter [Alphaproteobacteria bacterium]|nr:HlyC/CorC family transporter [Alphaproteobacteria bacterium]
MTSGLDNELVFYGAGIVVLLLISAFFSAAETALTALSRARIYHLVMDGNKRAQLVSTLRKKKEALIGTVLLGNNAVNIAASAIATTITIKLFGTEDGGLIIVTVAMTLLVVVFTEILPKTYAIQNSERVALAFAPALNILVKLLYPITHAIQIFIRLLLKLLGADVVKNNTLISATDVIRGTIELHHQEGTMIKQDRDMLGSILDLNDIGVGSIALHRKEVETIDADIPPAELMDTAVRTMHSRIPLYRGDPDNIIGLLHVKDLIKAFNDSDGQITSEGIVSICHTPWFIPETTSLRDQLLAFRAKRQHFAFVVDEYGAWLGIVTLEDIIEEIVGNIDDEHDETKNAIQKQADGSYLVSGDLSLRDLNRALDWNLPDEHAATVAGLLIHEAEKIPDKKESFVFHHVRFTVAEKKATQLTRLRLEKLSEPLAYD